MVQFFLRISQPKIYPKFWSIWLFSVDQKYAETTLLINEEYISQEASCTAQKSYRRVKSPKI